MRAADSKPRQLRTIMAGPSRGNDRFRGNRPFALSVGNETAFRGKFPNSLGRHGKPVRVLAGDVYRGGPPRDWAGRYRSLGVGRGSEVGGLRKAERANGGGVR